MMATKGHDLSAQVWSDVIATKLAHMCPLGKGSKQVEQLTLSVGHFELSWYFS